MLFELNISDFVLIKKAQLRFDEGLNVLTGETGAGKSMVLGALNLVMGGTASKDAVRIGSDKALINASFQTNPTVNSILMNQMIPTDDEVIILSREIQSKGKSQSRINGQMVTLSQLKQVTEALINIHGQNEHQTLLGKEEQLTLLDAYGGEQHEGILKNIRRYYDEINELRESLAVLEDKSNDRVKQLDYINYQINEIELAKLKPGEDIELEKSFEYLNHMGQIKETIENAIEFFNGDYGDGTIGSLSSINGQFRKLEGFHEMLDGFGLRLKDIFYLMEDLSKDLVHYSEKLDVDPEKLKALEERLDTINTLKTKYGQGIELIISHYDSLCSERENLESIESKIAEVNQAIENKMATYFSEASKLSELRAKAAKAFEKALEQELHELNMKEASFRIELIQNHSVRRMGIDEIDFLITTNIGQPFRALKKVVSGGELSRLMLAIKIVIGRIDEVATLVFDEIDTGISGITANIVGEKLSKIAMNSQIICITHLPQIAVYADHHYLIEKSSDGTQTETVLSKLDEGKMEDEISRLVGGAKVTESTTQHAREMLKNARDKKIILRH
ncbi:MAG: DNA repair protein RecN [Clostridiales bacterium 38-18]|nr:MAG: DNA repair protein RecN [Clostridiales bacterium 38-18]